MRIKLTHVVVAAIVAMAAAPLLVGAAEVAWGAPPGGRVDDLVFENGSFSTFPRGCCLGSWRTADGNASCGLERWLEGTIGDWTPLVRGDARRGQRTMGDMRTMATACESYSIDHVDYPRAHSVEELRPLLVPAYVEAVATHDGWGRPFVFESDGHGYRIASSGSDACWERADLPHPIGGFDWPTNRQLLGDLVRRFWAS